MIKDAEGNRVAFTALSICVCVILSISSGCGKRTTRFTRGKAGGSGISRRSLGRRTRVRATQEWWVCSSRRRALALGPTMRSVPDLSRSMLGSTSLPGSHAPLNLVLVDVVVFAALRPPERPGHPAQGRSEPISVPIPAHPAPMVPVQQPGRFPGHR